ncbi:hypothetical protein KAU45_08595, partial [bacterium]|nr:hypothetical protein [bacterium]
MIGLAGRVSAPNLAGEIDRQRGRFSEPMVIELLPGALSNTLTTVCKKKGAAFAIASDVLGREGIYLLDVESEALTKKTLRALRSEDFSRIIRPLFYWYRLRRACLGAAILEEALTDETYSVKILGAGELLAGVLWRVCRRGGVGFSASVKKPPTFSRRLRTIRSFGQVRILLNERLARWLKLSEVLLRSLGRREQGKPVDCLILTTLPTERATWMPLIGKMPDDVRVAVVTNHGGMLRDVPSGILSYNLDAWIRPGRLSRWIELYRRYWEIARELPDLLPTLPWRGLDLGEFARGWLLVMLRQVYWVLLSPAAALEELLNRVKPRLIVSLTERLELVNLAYQIAREKGIPTLTIESHDMIWDTPLFGPVAADRMAVSGEYSAEIYARGGAPREKLVVTGQPSFDRLAGYRETGPSKDSPERLLVVITQPPDVALTADMRCEMLEGALLAGREIPNLRVAIKPHPRENLDDLRLVLNELGAPREILLPKKLDLYKLLATSDVVLTAFSTVGVEAIMGGRPVVVLKTDSKSAVLPYVDSAAVLRATNAEEVAEAVKRALSDGRVKEELARGRQEYIEKYECAADGGSTARVTELILEMMGGG